MEITLNFDGACEPRNPGGTGAWAYVVSAPGLDKVTEGGTLPAAPNRTNNEMEYIALGKALRFLTETAAFQVVAGDHVAIRGDSKLVIEQLNGRWACNSPRLQRLLARCREILSALPCEWHAEWVPREANTEADARTRKVYEEATGRPMRERQPQSTGTRTGPSAGRCASCQAAILWAKTTAGNRMPLDAEPAPADAEKVCVLADGVAQFDLFGAPADVPRYRSHFATCPGAGSHRRDRTGGGGHKRQAKTATDAPEDE